MTGGASRASASARNGRLDRAGSLERLSRLEHDEPAKPSEQASGTVSAESFAGPIANPGAPHILVADDEPEVRGFLRRLLEDEGYRVSEAVDDSGVLTQARHQGAGRPDLILLDIRIPHQDGIAILQRLMEDGIETPVILMTGFTTATLTIKAMQMGAADYLTKPFTSLDEVAQAVEKVLKHERLKREVTEDGSLAARHDPSERIIGSTPEMIDIFKMVGLVARTPTTVLVTGETGVGKELMAEAIHNASDRRNGPLIKVNCAALPETLLESELFGHEKGSFTGAVTQHKGYFEMANKGTIFLDEVGEMTLGTQKKLLRVLQEREFERVGGTAPIKVDVRVLAATNRNLREEVLSGRFREDLYFRLNVIEIHMPPLRKRKDDIPALVSHFLDKHRASAASRPARISEEAIARLMAYDWPGNVRELENIVNRAIVLSGGSIITPDQIVFQNDLNRYVLDVEEKVRAGTPLDEMLTTVRREAIKAALRLTGNDYSKAADQLHVAREEFDALALAAQLANLDVE